MFAQTRTPKIVPKNVDILLSAGKIVPEVVQAFFDGRDPQAVRDMQKRILTDYALDISKHAKPEILGRIHQVWNSIPQQLAKCNKKFIYGDIQKGARAKDFGLHHTGNRTG